jgi:hypothetical protein
VDIEQTIRQGLELLSRVGGQMHPLASRYVQSIQELQSRLNALAASKNKPPSREARTSQMQSSGSAATSSALQPQSFAAGNQFPPQAQNQQTALDPSYAQDAYQSTLAEVSLRAGFEDEFSNIESMLMDSTGWTGLMDDWSDNPVQDHLLPIFV